MVPVVNTNTASIQTVFIVSHVTHISDIHIFLHSTLHLLQLLLSASFYFAILFHPAPPSNSCTSTLLSPCIFCTAHSAGNTLYQNSLVLQKFIFPVLVIHSCNYRYNQLVPSLPQRCILLALCITDGRVCCTKVFTSSYNDDMQKNVCY